MVFVKREQVGNSPKKRRIKSINLKKERDIVLLRWRIGNSLYTRRHIMSKTEPELCIRYKTKTIDLHLILECRKFKRERT